MHPSLVHTHQFRTRATLRIADNHGGTNNGCPPTDHVAGGLVKVDTKRAISHLGKHRPKTARSSTLAKAAAANIRIADNLPTPIIGEHPRILQGSS